ncbi:hypothetical protein ANN_14742 [Periplaneta americana]|uniref:Uncharacterized protein n=1 Tax=Periplaneta americana TaxID=6978 RepID=A0ABQ8SX78_PERAM|nr:hypothetical protein ANN_14742 [Periplaneta americana]
MKSARMKQPSPVTGATGTGDLSAELSQKRQRVHNVCVRFIFNIRRHDHISEYFLRLSWHRLQDRRLVHSLCLLYRIIHDSTTNYLASRFTFLASHHNRNTRSQHNLLLSILRHQTSLYSSSFTIAMARSWNSLPLEIRGMCNLFLNDAISTTSLFTADGISAKEILPSYVSRNYANELNLSRKIKNMKYRPIVNSYDRLPKYDYSFSTE